MKNKYLPMLFVTLLSGVHVGAQNKPQKSKEKPAQYFSESGIPLRMEEKKDAKGQLIEKTFYRARSKTKSDTINEKQLYTDGKLAETQFYTGDGKISFSTKYNSDGKEGETLFYESNGDINSKNVYSYGANGTTKTIEYSKEGNARSSTVRDGEGRILNEIKFSGDGTVKSKEVCQYDGKIGACKRAECLSYTGENILTRKEVIDHETNKRENTDYYASGKIKFFKVTENAWSRYSRVIQMDSYEEDGSSRKQVMQTFKSSKKGLSQSVPIELTNYSADGKLVSKLVFKYDDMANETEMTQLDAQGKVRSVTKHAYTYNANDDIEVDAVSDANGKLYYTDTFTRNEKGLKDITRKNSDGTTEFLMKDGKRIK